MIRQDMFGRRGGPRRGAGSTKAWRLGITGGERPICTYEFSHRDVFAAVFNFGEMICNLTAGCRTLVGPIQSDSNCIG